MVGFEQVEKNQLIKDRCVRFGGLLPFSGRMLAVHILMTFPPAFNYRDRAQSLP